MRSISNLIQRKPSQIHTLTDSMPYSCGWIDIIEYEDWVSKINHKYLALVHQKARQIRTPDYGKREKLLYYGLMSCKTCWSILAIWLASCRWGKSRNFLLFASDSLALPIIPISTSSIPHTGSALKVLRNFGGFSWFFSKLNPAVQKLILNAGLMIPAILLFMQVPWRAEVS